MNHIRHTVMMLHCYGIPINLHVFSEYQLTFLNHETG